MTNVFLDSNIWLRFIREDTDQAEQCSRLIKQIETGSFKAYTSTIVLLEIHFILSKFFEIKISEVSSDLETVLKTRHLRLIETTNLKRALALHKKTKVKLADCLIASQLPPKTTLVTFDRGFKKLPVNSKTPQEILTNRK